MFQSLIIFFSAFLVCCMYDKGVGIMKDKCFTIILPVHDFIITFAATLGVKLPLLIVGF